MRTNCVNCGAPVSTKHVVCTYCDTPYLNSECVTIDIFDTTGILIRTEILTPNEIRKLVRRNNHGYS